MLTNEMYSFFLIFLNLIFNFQKSRIGLFVTVFLTLYPYSSHSRLYHSSVSYGNIAVLKYHYESCHKDKTDRCMCGNIILSGICANNFSPWGCSLKNESGSSSSYSSSSGSSSSSCSSSSSSSGSRSSSGSIYVSNSDPNLNPNHNPNLSPEVLIRSCNKCNYLKRLTDFDESKYTCRSCTSAKVNCPYCTSVVRYDGIRAHVKKQHPDVELTRGFSRSLLDKRQNPRAVSPLVIVQTEESCSCEYYNFVSFLINNGINIEKVKENINLLKSIHNLK